MLEVKLFKIVPLLSCKRIYTAIIKFVGELDDDPEMT